MRKSILEGPTLIEPEMKGLKRMIRDGELDRDRTVGRLRREDKNMSKKFPECPLYNHNNCRDLHNPKICAVVKKEFVEDL